jgi:leader peptidase (prepilin peptidase)/N-methyltransferase
VASDVPLVHFLIGVFAFLFGVIFGSFLNVCIYRMAHYHVAEVPGEPGAMRPGRKYHIRINGRPALFYCEEAITADDGKVLYRGEWRLSVVRPTSACPKCGHEIRPYDNIPVLSWIILRGRCRDCGEPISPRYAAIELLTGLLFLACFLKFGAVLVTLKFCVFSFLVLGLIFTDAETKLLPDALTVPGILFGFAFSVVVPLNDLLSQLWRHEPWWFMSLADACVAAAVGAGFIYGAGFFYKLVRGVEGMGLGDVKLMAMIGAFLGLRLTLVTILGASVLGAIFGLAMVPIVWTKRTRRRMTRHHEPGPIARRRAWQSARNVYRYYAMPFGVFLGSMALFAAFFGAEILRWYWKFL